MFHKLYTKRDLLLEVLWHIKELADNILTMTNEDLELVLFKHLKRNLYLSFWMMCGVSGHGMT